MWTRWVPERPRSPFVDTCFDSVGLLGSSKNPEPLRTGIRDGEQGSASLCFCRKESHYLSSVRPDSTKREVPGLLRFSEFFQSPEVEGPVTDTVTDVSDHDVRLTPPHFQKIVKERCRGTGRGRREERLGTSLGPSPRDLGHHPLCPLVFVCSGDYGRDARRFL